MAQKLDIIAPSAPHGSSALTLHRWLKNIGEVMLINEPIAELAGSHMMIYVHAPAEGTLSTVLVQPGQNILSGAMLGQVTVVSRNEIEWGNFDTVTDILEDFADTTSSAKEMKDANEALGQLLGVGDNPVFQTMSIEEQNKFIQGVVDEHQSQGTSPAQVAQKLLVGMQLRTAPAVGPSGPALGFGLRGPAGPAPGGMGGGGINYAGITPQQQQGYAPYPLTPAPGQWPAPPQYGHGYPPQQPMHGQGYPIMPQQGQGYPPHGVPPVQPMPNTVQAIPAPKEDDKNE